MYNHKHMMTGTTCVVDFFQYEDSEESLFGRQTGEENVVESDDNIDEEPEEANYFISLFDYH